MSTHARLGASNAHIWMICTAQPAFTEGMTRNSSPAAAEGTLAHSVAETVLEGFPAPPVGSGYMIDGFPVFYDETMRDGVEAYKKTVGPLITKKARGLRWGMEQRVTLSPLLPRELQDEEVFGTVDLWAYGDRALSIFDFKYGRGKSIEAEGNPQLLFYAVGVALLLDMQGIDTVTMTIVQPRQNRIVRDYGIRFKDLMLWATQELVPTIYDILNYRTRFTPGEHCWFCPGSKTCLALAEYKRQRSVMAFEREPWTYDDVNEPAIPMEI